MPSRRVGRADLRTGKIRRVFQRLEKLEKDFADVVKSWDDKMSKFLRATAIRFGTVETNQQVVTQCIEQLDVQRQVHEQIMREAYARFQLLDSFLQGQNARFDDLSPQQVEDIKRDARDTFNALFDSKLELVQEEREAEIKRQQEEAKKAQKAKDEAERAEEALRTAESPDSLKNQEPGGEGAEIPEGAQVFGG